MQHLIDDLRDRIKSNVLIYSLVLGYPPLKLSSLFTHQRFLKPSYQLNDLIDQNPSPWPISDNIDSIFQNESLIQRISLENEQQLESLVEDRRYVPTIFFALLNILKQNVLLDRMQSLRIISALLFSDPHIDIILEQCYNIDGDQE